MIPQRCYYDAITQTRCVLTPMSVLAQPVGLSANDFAYIQHFDQALGGMDTLQIDDSLLNRQPERDALSYCQEHNIGLIVRGPLTMGKLCGKFTPDTTFPEGISAAAG